MFATATRFAVFSEPEPLDAYGRGTAANTLAATDMLLDRLDREVTAEGPQAFPDFLVAAWTHVGRELNPLFTEEIIFSLAGAYGHSWADLSTRRHIWDDLAARRSLWVHPVPGRHRAEAWTASAQLDSSLAEIQGWLGVALGVACEAAGISRGTVYAWRERNSSPRPGTVASILRVHGLIASAVAFVGVGPARAWFHSGDPTPLDALVAARGDVEDLRRLSTRIRRELATIDAPPPNRLIAATVDDLDR